MVDISNISDEISDSNIDEYDENEHVKETFAYFGRAYYMANVFEAGLAIALMQLDFLTEVRARFISSRGKNFDRAQYESDFDQFMDRQHAQTLGNLIKNAKKHPVITSEFHDRLTALKKMRDFLAHHFFRERSAEFASRRGRDGMIAELEDAHELFCSADRELDKLLEPIRRKLGFDEAMIKTMTEKYIEEAMSGD